MSDSTRNIDKGLVKEETGVDASRKSLQITTLLETLRLTKLMVQWGGADEMRKKLEPKKDFFHTEMNLVNGIQKIKDQNYGTYLMEEKFWRTLQSFSDIKLDRDGCLGVYKLENIELLSLYFSHQRECIM